MSDLSARPPLGIGSIVADRYRLVRPLGEGGMGTVFEAEHLALGRRFALKVLRIDKWNAELVERFQREARALARLATPRVAQVTDFGVDPAVGPFYVMELAGGETLEKRLERDEVITPEEAVRIAIGIAEALADVHRAGVVHRDIKPSNVALGGEGPIPVKLLDFGLAASVDDSFLQRITRSHQVLGSLPYMAPEQFHGARPAPALDLWALGVVLFEMLAGRLPFVSESAAALIHQILAAPVPEVRTRAGAALPPAIGAVLGRLLAKDVAARFATADDAARALRASVEGGAIALPPTVESSAMTGPLPPTRAIAFDSSAETALAVPSAAASIVTTAGVRASRRPIVIAAVAGAAAAAAGAVIAIALLGGDGEKTEPVAPVTVVPAAAAAAPSPAPPSAPVQAPSEVAAPARVIAPSAEDAGPPRTASAVTARQRVPRPTKTRSATGAWRGDVIEDPGGGGDRTEGTWGGGIIDEPQ